MTSEEKQPHGNDLDNPNDHVLYGVYDHEDRVLIKFGISEQKDVNNSKLPSRLLSQLITWNRVVGFIRFTGRVLIWMIPGRLKARRLEDDLVDKYTEKHGGQPRGNKNHPYLSAKRRAQAEEE